MNRTRLAAALAVTLLGGAAHAAPLDTIGAKLIEYEAEIRQIGRQITAPKEIGMRGTDISERRLINAQVAFGVGNYDDAAIMLYDLVEKGSTERWYDEALYFLAESLFQKKDYIGARNYFLRVVDDIGAQSTYYQQSLERLIELSLKLHDETDVPRWLDALSKVPASKRRSSVPYVRGRYMYFSGDFETAAAAFQEVPSDSEYYIRARYFLGATHVARGELADAATVFTELAREKPQTEDDKRVVELSHLALGRLYYERDQPGKAIDEYLMISRKSDLFDQALFEIAWVYVKDRQFDKALRALELLALANPESAMLPDVRILEGNLRIRKAAVLEESGASGNAVEEYDKAMGVFEDTRDTFEVPRAEIERIIAEREDPRKYVNQITGRSSETFDVDAAKLPAVAVAWLREEPEVGRVVDLDQDLITIRADLDVAESNLTRVERALASPSKVNVFPALAEKRSRLTEITEDLMAMRRELANERAAMYAKYASGDEVAAFERVRADRQRVEQELAALPDAGLAYSERVAEARAKYDALAARAQQLEVLVDKTQARLVAVEKYLADQRAAGVPEETLAQYKVRVDELRAEVTALRAEIAALRTDITLGKDQAGVGDREALRARELRADLERLLDEEQRMFGEVAARMSGADRTRADQIASLETRAAAMQSDIEGVDGQIDEIVDVALAEVRTAVAEERARLVEYRRELEELEAEAQEVGGEVLSASFGKVSNKFYEVLVRSDVGVIDVAWANRERATRGAKRLNLDRARERRMLDDEFREVLDAQREVERSNNPAVPPPASPPPTTPAPEGAGEGDGQ